MWIVFHPESQVLPLDLGNDDVTVRQPRFQPLSTLPSFVDKGRQRIENLGTRLAQVLRRHCYLPYVTSFNRTGKELVLAVWFLSLLDDTSCSKIRQIAYNFDKLCPMVKVCTMITAAREISFFAI